MLKLISIEERMIRTQIFQWFFKFKIGMTSAKNAKFYCPSTRKTEENMIQVKELVHRNRDLTIPELVMLPKYFDTKSEHMTTAKSVTYLPTIAESIFWLVYHDFKEHFTLTSNSFLKSSAVRVDEFIGTILKE
jgi:hypothetical protein